MRGFFRDSLRYCCVYLSLTFSLCVQAETLSEAGAALDDVNIFADTSTVEKSIDVSALGLSDNIATYLFAEPSAGNFVQLTDAGYQAWDEDWQNLHNLALSVSHNTLSFSVPPLQSIDFTQTSLPLQVTLGLKDIDTNTLYYGTFQITSNDVFQYVDNATWDESAVRRVLHLFALGGFASDAQIQTWADANPWTAIQEILTFDTHHPLLSPPDPIDQLNTVDGSLIGLHDFWSSDAANNPTPSEQREKYQRSENLSVERVWRAAATRRGLNPVRQMIGLWETNYHMAVNQQVGLNEYQISRYYDDIMNTQQSGQPYQNALGVAASSAAVASQYNHSRNLFINGKFYGNEDFAREFHQLFFGILGHYDEVAHEEITIKNTAKALTGMPVEYIRGSLNEVCSFNEEEHHSDDLLILGESISGQFANNKMHNLAQVAIRHEESLANLPIIIIRGLADDNLDAAKIDVIQASWQAMDEKNLLTFLRRYAISTIFHDSSRYKFYHSAQRVMLKLNKLTLNNQESYDDRYDINSYTKEGIQVFRPIHDVFGGQTGSEAADDAEVFRNIYKASTTQAARFNQTHDTDTGWEKDWGSVAPREADDSYKVSTVAEWLWRRFVADGLNNYGTLERLQIHALLAHGFDAGWVIDAQNADRLFDENDADLPDFISDWGDATLDLGAAEGSTARRTANHRVGQAINFITATPYALVQEGR